MRDRSTSDNKHEIEMISPTSGPRLTSRDSPASGQQDRLGQRYPEDQYDSEHQVEAEGPAWTTAGVRSSHRWKVLALLASLGVLVVLGRSGPELGPSSENATDPTVQEGSGDSANKDPLLSEGVAPEEITVGPEALRLLAPVGEFVTMRDQPQNQYGITGDLASYSVVIGFGGPDVGLIDLGTGVETRLPAQASLLLATDEYLLTYGGTGATGLTVLADPKDSFPTAGGGPQAQARVESLELGQFWSDAFPAERDNQFWLVAYLETGPVLQLRRLPEGTIVQEFATDELDWHFSGGVPIGVGTSGRIYELAPGAEGNVRPVADAELVDADPGRAIVRSCDDERSRCTYQWLSRANWAPLDLVVPAPDALDWRIEGGGRWLVSDSPTIQLIELETGRTLTLDLGSARPSVNARVVSVSSDGRWLGVIDGSDLIMVNLSTGDQFLGPVSEGSRILGIVENSQAPSLLATHPMDAGLQDDSFDLSGFRSNGRPPLDAAGVTILVTGWTGAGATLEVATGETNQIGGLSEIQLMSDGFAVGLTPANDLASVDLTEGSMATRRIGEFANLAVLPGDKENEIWLTLSDPNINEFRSDLTLLELGTLEVVERGETQILSWHAGGDSPLGTSLSEIFRYQNGELDLIRRGILVVADSEKALIWECAADRFLNDQVANDQATNDQARIDRAATEDRSALDECGFVWRDRLGWSVLDLEVPTNPAGIGGLFGSGRWLLTFSSAEESFLFDIETGKSITFDENWITFFDVSPDGRWAIHSDLGHRLVLTDLDSAVFDSGGNADHRELIQYWMGVDQRVRSLRFLLD